MGSLVERIHTKAARLSISILVSFFSSSCSKSESTRGWGYRNPQKVLHSYRHKIFSNGNFNSAVNSILALNKFFPTSVYPQFTRMNENEDELEKFYRFWHSKNSPSVGKVIIQKYNDFCKLLPSRKPADLSPLERNVCWHLKRDMTILCTGDVPLCRQFLFSSIGNVFDEGVENIWKKYFDEIKNQLEKKYGEKCKDCDEYYTFNF